MMGVKPNRKSSIITMMLLLFFALVANAMAAMVRDTLILDGEIIEIDPNDRSNDKDSLEEWGKRDYRTRVAGKSQKILGFQIGLLHNRVKSINERQDLTFLDDYMELNNADGTGLDVVMKYQHELINRAWRGKKMSLGIEGMAGYRQFKWSSWTMDASVINQDSLIGFRREGEELWLDYVTIFDGPVPVYELDTILVPVNKVKLISHQTQFRIGPYINRELSSNFFAGVSIGVDYRMQSNIKNNTTFYWLGEMGRFVALSSQTIGLKRYLLTPYCSVQLSKMQKDKWLTGITSTIMAPGAIFNDHPDLQWTAWQIGLAINVAYTF